MGRDRDVAELRQLVGSARLVTLTGPGGVGKTTLALEVAASMRRDFDRVEFVALAPVGEADAVLPAIAEAFALGDADDRPPLEALRDHLREERVLMVLDNFEPSCRPR